MAVKITLLIQNKIVWWLKILPSHLQ